MPAQQPPSLGRSAFALGWPKLSAVTVLLSTILACGDDTSDTVPTNTTTTSSSTGTPSNDGSTTGSSASDSESDSTSGTTVPPTVRGEVEVVEVATYSAEEPGKALLWGRVAARFYEGTQPAWHHETTREGDCRLLEYTPGICDEFCDGVCVGTNDCQAWPTYLSVGTITVAGLTAPLTMNADSFDKRYVAADVPAELFTDQAAVHATSSGADLPALDVQASGVVSITSDITDGEVVLIAGQDRVIHWTPAVGSANTRVRLTLNANNIAHGQPFTAIIECDVADSQGQVTVPASLIGRFPVKENAEFCVLHDCPLSSIRRYSSGVQVWPDGEVQLIVGSQFEFGLARQP